MFLRFHVFRIDSCRSKHQSGLHPTSRLLPGAVRERHVNPSQPAFVLHIQWARGTKAFASMNVLYVFEEGRTRKEIFLDEVARKLKIEKKKTSGTPNSFK